MRFKNTLVIILFFALTLGCKEDPLPKPKAMLRLDYKAATFTDFETSNFKFNFNALSELSSKNEQAITLNYPKMNGSIFITYKKVENNINKLLTDAQKLSYEHAAKADGILPNPFVNKDAKVYGMFYEVSGDAASQSQFYVTDSVNHFLTGSLYFYAKPNYDSIYPAAMYLQEDIRHIMESLRWKK